MFLRAASVGDVAVEWDRMAILKGAKVIRTALKGLCAFHICAGES
jgi:hypothetical protein